MRISQNLATFGKSGSAMERIQSFLEQRRSKKERIEDLESFERELHAMFMAAEREVLGEEIGRLDIDVPVIEVEGIVYRKVIRCEETYFSAAGPIRVERSLYSTRQDGERAICPLELRAGMVEGRWTPLAAKQAMWVVAHLTPKDGEALFAMLGGMNPSKSSLDRLPKELGERWEKGRETFEASLREGEDIPKDAVTVAVSLDGVMVPMKDGERDKKRAKAAAAGKRTRGPAGNREVGCGTLTLYDEEGEPLVTRRMGRMPESKKVTLKEMLRRELSSVLEKGPDLKLVKAADGAKDNWTFLSNELLPGQGIEVVDFFHAIEHLKRALDAAYGENSPKAKSQYEKLRHILRHDLKGADKVIRSLCYLRDKHPRRKKIATELKYFRKNRHRMQYAELAAQNLPIGTGIMEAACKTLATQRLKRSGMRWGNEGGQAILTFRSLVQSNRFDRAWDLLSACYTQEVKVPENVVAMSDWRY